MIKYENLTKKQKKISISLTRAKSLGMMAKRYSDRLSYKVDKIQHQDYGTVNIYHIDVLREVFRSDEECPVNQRKTEPSLFPLYHEG
jgi:hypothetical protein